MMAKTKERSIVKRADYPKIKPRLTRRETEVAVHTGAGLTCPEIGEVLGISTETVRSHMTRIRDKTGIRRKAQLAQWADTNDESLVELNQGEG